MSVDAYLEGNSTVLIEDSATISHSELLTFSTSSAGIAGSGVLRSSPDVGKSSKSSMDTTGSFAAMFTAVAIEPKA